MRGFRGSGWALCLAGVFASCTTGHAADPRDGDLHTLDGYFPFHVMESPKAWHERAEEIRLRVRVAAGLWPEPTKCALNAVVRGRADMGDYTIEKVFFESMPGHFVTGNLYRPKGEVGGARRPAVLMPHGHWPNGRFMDAGQGKGGARQLREMFAIGAERFDAAARSPLQARCVQAARMGCVVFHYDMLGMADSIQFPQHRRAMPEDGGEGWHMGGAAASNYLQSRFGLQTWNGVRAMDFILGLPDVDPKRVAVSGASGGGTQTMMLTAVDDRVAAAFPAVMVSTAMQGGCACENAIYLRIGQGNIDIAAVAAPRPLGLTSADDWTVELETKGHPELSALYKMLGAAGNYEAHFNTQFKHNYNQVSRSQFFTFINRCFKLGLDEPVLERDFEFLGSDRLTVWDKEYPAPSGASTGDAHERSLCKWWAADAQAQMKPLLQPKGDVALARAREVIGGALSVMVGRRMGDKAKIEFLVHEESAGKGFSRSAGMLRHTGTGEEVGISFLQPTEEGKARNGVKGTVVWMDPRGSAGLFDGSGALTAEVGAALAGGWAVAGIDVHRFGAKLNRRVVEPKAKPSDPWQRDPILTYGYNSPLFVQRVHDVMTTVAWLRAGAAVRGGRVRIMGLRGAGHLASVAAAALGDAVERMAIDVSGFRFSELKSPWDADFLPGAAKYGDIGGVLLLSVPRPLWVTGAGDDVGADLRAAYAAAGAAGRLAAGDAGGEGATARAVAWLLTD